MSGAVAELIRHTHPTVLSWPQSQRVGDPELFAAGELDGLINVRYFSIANDPGAMVMDTLGLHVFGLPDVQCHFRDRGPAEIATMLFSTAAYLFRSGDVIADGTRSPDRRAMSGWSVSVSLPCSSRGGRSSMSILRPVRGRTARPPCLQVGEERLIIISDPQGAAYRQQLDFGR
jgi:hypothetical protein